jgi:apolipoprotein N-acyltransferase
LIAFAAGVAGAYSVAPAAFGLLPVFSISMLLYALNAKAALGRRIHAAAIKGWLFGFGYFLVSVRWLVTPFLITGEHVWLAPVALIAVPACLALFTAIACATARRLSAGPVNLLPLAAALGAAEWLRSQLFPWNLHGMGLACHDALLQWASVIGVNGLTVAAVLIGGAPYAIWHATKRRKTAALALAAFAAFWAVGAVRLHLAQPTVVLDVVLRLVQPALPHQVRFDTAKRQQNFDQMLALTLRNPKGDADDLRSVTHVLWPEYAVPFRLLEAARERAAIAAVLPPGVTLIAGNSRREYLSADRKRFISFNSLLAIASDGSIAGIYDKRALVPIGEFLPFRSSLGAFGLKPMGGDFTLGDAHQAPWRIAGLPPFIPAICYEINFPALTRQARTASPLPVGVILNPVYDGWLGPVGASQHFEQARARAVEQGLPVVRAAYSGTSAVIDPYGRVTRKLAWGEAGTLDAMLPQGLAPTIYARFGDLPLWLMIGLLLLAMAVRGGNSRRLKPPAARD